MTKTSKIFQCEDLNSEQVLGIIDRHIEKLESGETIEVPNIHHRNAMFTGVRWVMPRKFVKWSKKDDYGQRLLIILKTLREFLSKEEMKGQRDLFYNLLHKGIFRSGEKLSNPYETLTRVYIPRIEGLVGAERENLNLFGRGRGYIWSPRGRMSTPKRRDTDLSSAPAIRSDVRQATLTGTPDVVISVEKASEQEVLEDSGIADLLDFMVVVPRGRTNREALRFLKKCEKEGKRIFTLNDGDIVGLTMPLEMMGLSKSSAHLGDDFRPNVEHIGIYSKVLSHAGVLGVPESSLSQKEDAIEKAANLDRKRILADLKNIEKTGKRWETSALDPYDHGLETYLIEAFRAFGVYDDRLFDPSEISPEIVRGEVPSLIWKKIKRKGKIDADDLATNTICERLERISEYQTKFHYSPSGEAREKIDDWIRKKAESHLEEESPELPDKNEVRKKANEVLSGLPNKLFPNLAIDRYNKDPLGASPTNDSVAEELRDKMLNIRREINGKTKYQIDSHETPEGNLKVEITVEKPDFTVKVEDPEINEVEDPKPSKVTTPYDYAHDTIGTDDEFARDLREGLERMI